MNLLRAGILLEIAGLLLGLVSVVRFHRLSMTAFFAIGIPLVLGGVALYLVSVLRELVKKGAL